MKSILFFHSHTLYAKATIPIALACLDRGWQITFAVNRLTFFGKSWGFSDKSIKRKPTAVKILNPESFDFVSGLIGLNSPWHAATADINYSRVGEFSPKSFDAIVGTIKDIVKLSNFSASGTPTFAVGYEHLPILARVGNYLESSTVSRSTESVFFSDNEFSNCHGFTEIVKGHDVRLNAFTHLDQVYASGLTSTNSGDQVLIFHPGGYRNIVSAPGDDKDKCYAGQKALLERLCLPLIEQGLTPCVKVHPLRAQYHDYEDLQYICSSIEKQHKLRKQSIKILGPKELFWKTAFNSAFIITFGSTAMYELWSVGLKNVHVCNFEGTTRSENFEFFPSVFINTISEFEALVQQPGKYSPTLDPLAECTYSTYKSLFNGCAALEVIKAIDTI